MSLQTTSYVLKRTFGNQIRKLLMIAIADYTGDDTGTGWAFIDTLAQRAECSRRSVQGHLDILEAQGELEIYRNAGPGGSHRFRVLFKTSEEGQMPAKGGANPARGVQVADDQTAKGGANGVPSVAPKTIQTVRRREEREERAPAASFSPDEFCDLIDAVNAAREEWTLVEAFTAAEKAALIANAAALKSISPETWQTIRRYLRARIPDGVPKWQPTSRLKFLEAPGDVVTHAIRWHGKQRKDPPLLPPPPSPATSPSPPLSREAVALALSLTIPSHESA
jgi:hypothetical protein